MTTGRTLKACPTTTSLQSREDIGLAVDLGLPGTSSTGLGEIKAEPIVSDYTGEFVNSLDAKQAIPSPDFSGRGSRACPAPNGDIKEEPMPLKKPASKKGETGYPGFYPSALIIRPVRGCLIAKSLNP